MKHSFLIVGLFAFICVFTSCSEDNFDTTTTDVEQIDVKQSTSQNNIMTRASSNSDESTDLVFECLSLKYPFELVDVNANIIVVDNDAQYESVVFDSLVIDFNYPLSLIDSGGDIVVAEDATEFAELFAACIPFDIWDNERFPAYLIDDANECYALVFPLSVQNESGENLEIANRNDFLDAITNEGLFFNFPFNIVTTDGNEFSINSIDDFYNAIFNCNGINTDSLDLDWEDGFEYLACYKIEFPIAVESVDGVQIEVPDHEILCELMIEGKMEDFYYPLSLIGEDGAIINASSKEELEELLNSCYGVVSFSGGDISLLLESSALRQEEACYIIDYPISIIPYDTDGNVEVLQVNSDEELSVYEFDDYALEFPINITYTDGRTATIGEYEELITISIGCYVGIVDPGFDDEAGLGLNSILEFSDCFDLSFPVNAMVFDTTTFEETGEWTKSETYTNMEDLVADLGKVYIIEFPFIAVLKSDGKEEELTTLEDFEELIEGCN